jgi:hypothetical protein
MARLMEKSVSLLRLMILATGIWNLSMARNYMRLGPFGFAIPLILIYVPIREDVIGFLGKFKTASTPAEVFYLLNSFDTFTISGILLIAVSILNEIFIQTYDRVILPLFRTLGLRIDRLSQRRDEANVDKKFTVAYVSVSNGTLLDINLRRDVRKAEEYLFFMPLSAKISVMGAENVEPFSLLITSDKPLDAHHLVALHAILTSSTQLTPFERYDVLN